MGKHTMSTVHTAVLLALSGGALAQPAAPAAPAAQRIEITGSAIRRIAAEGALPVVTLNRDQVDKSGATSLADLVQALPSMQGFTNEGAAVGGGGNGFSGASLHNLGGTRTLVLLNGRRLASFAGQFITGSLAGIDLNTIPISAIERVEILADGASALYGADAIGGVVNFITKRNTQAVELNVGGTWPDKVAQEARVAVGRLRQPGGRPLERAGRRQRRKAHQAEGHRPRVRAHRRHQFRPERPAGQLLQRLAARHTGQHVARRRHALPNRNLGDLVERGIDVDAQARFATPVGRLTSTLGFSYHMKSEYQLEPGGPFFTSLGQFGADGNVVFRWQGRLINTLEHGNFAHTLTLAFKSGYADQTYTAGDFAVFGTRRRSRASRTTAS